MNDAEMLKKLESSFETLSKEKNAIVVPLNDIVKKSGFAPNQVKKCENLLRQSGLYKLDSKKEGVLVNKKNIKPMEPTMQIQQPTNTPPKLHDRLERIINALAQGLYEKRDAVRLALLTAVAGESIFLLGKPGYAKSMIACRLREAFKSDGNGKAKYFEYLMNQFSTPEDIFGPISLKALNGEGESEEEEYKRIIKNMLPEADIAFLDEIWKASAAIQNTLLTIINERKYSNGNEVIKVPLKALFAASNELPAKDRGLEALFDRFILRLIVEPIEDEDNFFEMIEEPSSQEFELPDDVEPISVEEWESWKKKIDQVTLSSEARSVISAIRKELVVRNNAMSEEGKQDDKLFEVSDRRWKKIAHILKTSAFLNDRTEVDLMDCQLIEYCIWSTEKQQKLAREIVKKCIQQNGLDCDTAIDEIKEQIEEFEKKVNEQWFYMEGDKPLTYKMRDGKLAYKITQPKEIKSYDSITPAYLCKEYEHSSYDRHGAYYDKNGDFMGDYDYYFKDNSFVLYGKHVNWIDGYTDISYSTEIATRTGGLMKKNFSDIAHETLQERFTKAAYMPIVSQIESEITKLNDQKNSSAIPFKSNLFANQEYNTIITTKIDDAIRELQDAQISLDKQRNRYLNTKLSSKFTVGDVILKNGVVFSATEVAALTTEQKKDVIAVVCITGEKTYAIGIDQYMESWEDIPEIASNYASNNDLPNEYSSNWIVPNKDLLHMIWQNRETINKSLEQLESACTLDEEEYWSSSTNGNSAAFYQMFDEDGQIDHTTKDHEYSVCVIREWEKE
jgi:MoxR-like ATPase